MKDGIYRTGGNQYPDILIEDWMPDQVRHDELAERVRHRGSSSFIIPAPLRQPSPFSSYQRRLGTRQRTTLLLASTR